ncbi:MAG: aminomethyltransferase family protein [Thermoleophilia bacterium]
MGSTDIIRTAFDGPQRALGCEFMDWEGWMWPSTFGDAVAEHHAVRDDVGVWDASPLRKWGFDGADAFAAADRIFTNDMLGLVTGQVRYAPFCDENGKMVGDGTVFKVTDTFAIVVTALDSDLDHFRSVVHDLDVEITPQTAKTPQVGINGPRALELLQSICAADVSSLRYFRFWSEKVEVGGVPCRISRTGYSGELGFEIFCSPDGAEELWAAVVGAGARPYGLAAVETIRIESGLIFIGYDYFPGETSPYDMSLDKMIRFDGPDFCGKAVLEAESTNPANRFVTLVLDGDEVPEYGAAVTKDGMPVGTLTSPCESPTLGKVIGLAVIETGSAAVGERVEVAVGEGTAAATVATLPVYDPEKKRPRA